MLDSRSSLQTPWLSRRFIQLWDRLGTGQMGNSGALKGQEESKQTALFHGADWTGPTQQRRREPGKTRTRYTTSRHASSEIHLIFAAAAAVARFVRAPEAGAGCSLPCCSESSGRRKCLGALGMTPPEPRGDHCQHPI